MFVAELFFLLSKLINNLMTPFDPLGGGRPLVAVTLG